MDHNIYIIIIFIIIIHNMGLLKKQNNYIIVHQTEISFRRIPFKMRCVEGNVCGLLPTTLHIMLKDLKHMLKASFFYISNEN